MLSGLGTGFSLSDRECAGPSEDGLSDDFGVAEQSVFDESKPSTGNGFLKGLTGASSHGGSLSATSVAGEPTGSDVTSVTETTGEKFDFRGDLRCLEGAMFYTFLI